MKKTLSLIVCISIMAVSAFAQRLHYTPQGEDRQKEISGRYGSSDGICLFVDGTFMLYGYATAVFGHYDFEKDYLLFYPDKQDLFELYAHQNPSLGDGARMAFVGFEDGNTYVQFDKDSIQQVFNDDANCFSSPFVYEKNNFPKNICLYADDHGQDSALISWNYRNDQGCNDFVFVHNKIRREYENFSGTLYRNDDNQLEIHLSNYGGQKGYKKQENDREWKDILIMKNEYAITLKSSDFVLLNNHYGTFVKDLSDYKLDKNSNQYISGNVTDNDAYFKSNVYLDDRYLRKYSKQQPLSKVLKGREQYDFSTSTIFFSSCTEVEKSYHYKKDVVEVSQKERPMPVVLPALPTLSVNEPGGDANKNSSTIKKDKKQSKK